MSSGFLGRLREWLHGKPATNTPAERRDATQLVATLLDGELRRLSDQDLGALIEVLLGTPTYRTALRGNARFLESVARRFAKTGEISYKQRYAIYNVLERAYPHNLAAGLLRPRQ